MNAEAHDDVDRLFARLERIEPPADFAARVATATYAAPRPVTTRQRFWLALDAAALVLLAVVSVWFGVALEETGALDVLSLLLVDLEAAREGFGAFAEALLAAVPWVQLLVLIANAAVVAALSQRALAGSERAARPAG
jgi:hypothetical protein